MPALMPEDAANLAATGGYYHVDADIAPRFGPGDAITTKNINPPTHTRLPRYLRARRGVIQADHGIYVFPDTHASGLGEKPQHLYAVRFSAKELWGDDANANDAVYVDVWDDYIV